MVASQGKSDRPTTLITLLKIIMMIIIYSLTDQISSILIKFKIGEQSELKSSNDIKYTVYFMGDGTHCVLN